jgi:hypothetical protein
MIDLEEEFDKLMQESIAKVRERLAKGELSLTEAADLIRLIETRMRAHSYEDEDPYYEEDRGWRRSSWCGDNG